MFTFQKKQGYLYGGFRTRWYSNETYNYEVYQYIDNDKSRYSFDKSCDTDQLLTDTIQITVKVGQNE